MDLLRRQAPPDTGSAGEPAAYSGAGAYYSILDLDAERPGAIADNLRQEFSPLKALARQEKTIRNAALDRFVQLAIAKNANIDFSNDSTGHQGFDLLDDNSRSREIIQRTLEFLRAHNSQ
jgi:hypothetical protein